MPCWESRKYSVEFKAQNFGILLKAVQAMGGQMQRNGERATVVLKNGETITIEGGKATGYGRDALTNINDLRVRYSQQIVATAKQWATAKGWTAQQTSANKLTLSKGNR